ncbi:alpha/beta fold hydrolase, partial [Intestinibacter sp.]|uniref:alpha/beta fold hydrolase n=1 Tax=Intestinibacter sp. TaxID=1965304 RepID=UPI003F1550B6
SGLGEIISYAQTADMDGIYQSVVSSFDLASAEGEVSTVAESTASEYFEYTEVDGGVSITKYTGSDTEVVIPSTIDGKDVKTIGQSAFAGSKTLVSVVIPDGVTEIGSYAFSGCSKLGNVTMPDSLTKIGNYAFNECTNLVGIGIPSSVITIGNYAFYDCSRLRNVELPSKLENLGDYAFYNNNILGVTIPDTIKTIGRGVFAGCWYLSKATLPEGLTEIPTSMFSSCPKFYQVNIPSTVKSIGQSAFSGCYNLKEIYLPDGLEKIGNFAFYVCTSLETIDLPDTVTSIGPGAFSNCTSLNGVVLPQGLTELGTESFRYCKSLTSIVIPKNITYIYSDTFQGCESLTSVKLYQGVTNIGGNAFQGCTNLKEIYMPKTIVKIGDSYTATAFDDCTNLTMYVYRDSVSETYAIDNSIPYEYIDDAAFDTRIQIEKDSYEFYTSSTSGIDVNFFSRTISTDEITWTSSDESVAKINSATNYINESSDTYDTTINLQIKTFDKTGKCTITGETSDGITVSCTVKVLNPYEETVEDDPIIILPGVMGSRLFSTYALDYDKSSVIWDPQVGADDILGSADSLVGLSNDLLGNLYVKPPQNQQLLKEHENSFGIEYREYGAQNAYKNLVDTLCDSTDRPVYFFSYNWMESNLDSADKLREFINELDVDKVDLVCHSMGGIVASSYMSKYKSEDKVDKIITCGTPYEGAPGIINKIQNWDILVDNDNFILTDSTAGDVLGDVALGLLGGLTKQTKTKITTAAELVPSENYVSRVAMYKKGIPFKEEISFDEYKTICKNIFKEKYDDGLIFQESLKGSTGYNNLLDYDKAYFLIGTNQKTITSIVFDKSDDISSLLYEDDLKYESKGDGTVPYISATMSQSVKRLSEDRYCFADGNHTQIVKKAKTIEWIKEKLQITDGT